MSLWQSETLTVTNSNLMVVNRGFSINWQNEAHQSRRGEWCRGSVLSEGPAVTRVSGTGSLSPCVSHHMWLSADISPTHSDSLCFFLSHLKCGLDGIFCQSRLGQNCQNTLLNFSFWGGYSFLMTCYERLVTPLLLLSQTNTIFSLTAVDNFLKR